MKNVIQGRVRELDKIRVLIASPKPDQLFINLISLFSMAYETYIFYGEAPNKKTLTLHIAVRKPLSCLLLSKV